MSIASSYGEEDIECPQCDEKYTTEGHWEGDGWDVEREFVANEELCPRCLDGLQFILTFKVVGYEDFSKLTNSPNWTDWFEGFDEVYLKEVEIKHGR
jgi:hypothetical protein